AKVSASPMATVLMGHSVARLWVDTRHDRVTASHGPYFEVRENKRMKKMTPHLWFDKEAKEAAGFYTSVFPNAKVTNITTLHDTPSGDCDIVSFELSGQPFMAISAGPLFKFSPSVSFI